MTTSSGPGPGPVRGEERYDRDDERYGWRETGSRPEDRYEPRGGNWGGGQRRERGFFISTEARHGFMTTEFWLTLIGVAALVILAFAVDEIGDRFGIVCATAVLVAYVLSRGIAKAGSSEQRRRRDDD
jgi:hypothetical protein